MCIFIKNRLPAYVSSKSGTQILRLTHHLCCQQRKFLYQLYLLPLEFCNLNLRKISAGLFWLTCLVYSALQIQLWVPSHGNKTCTKSLFTHICHIRERIKLIACAILQAFESMSFRLKVMSLIILLYPLQTQLHLLCFFFFVAHTGIWNLSHLDLYYVR